jgi:heterodisulfide reductase subunit C
MDLTFGEVMQAAARNDVRALTNRTLWACDSVLAAHARCQEGIDLAAVIRALREEALRRGDGKTAA